MPATAAREARSRIPRRRCPQFRGHLRCRLTLKGQAFAEYAILIGLVTAAMLGMSLYAKRGLQAGIKMAADDLSPFKVESGGDPQGEKAQVAAVRYESRERRDRAVGVPGTILVNEATVRTRSDRAQEAKQMGDGAVGRRILTQGRAGGDTVNTEGALSARGANVSSYSEVVISSK